MHAYMHAHGSASDTHSWRVLLGLIRQFSSSRSTAISKMIDTNKHVPRPKQQSTQQYYIRPPCMATNVHILCSKDLSAGEKISSARTNQSHCQRQQSTEMKVPV